MSTSHPGQHPAMVAAAMLAVKTLELGNGELTPETEAAIEAEAEATS